MTFAVNGSIGSPGKCLVLRVLYLFSVPLYGLGKQWYFGMKVHTGTDAESVLVHTVRATSANVADVNVLGELLWR